jgi:hypothetical protein
VQALVDEAKVLELEWQDLLPEDERKDYNAGPPAATHDYLSGESGLASQQVMNFNVNTKLDQKQVKLPGFIVPLELDDNGKVTEFFLVPYFGACIHVPPPPANQMVYVTLKEGVQLDSMYAAFWIVGKMSARGKSTRLGAAAYGIAATRLEEYKYSARFTGAALATASDGCKACSQAAMASLKPASSAPGRNMTSSRLSRRH